MAHLCEMICCELRMTSFFASMSEMSSKTSAIISFASNLEIIFHFIVFTNKKHDQNIPTTMVVFGKSGG